MGLKVVHLRHVRAVPDPVRNDVDREFLDKLRLPAGPEVLKDALPRFQSGPADDPECLGTEVAPLPQHGEHKVFVEEGVV